MNSANDEKESLRNTIFDCVTFIRNEIEVEHLGFGFELFFSVWFLEIFELITSIFDAYSFCV